jgi:hypothetical protein
MFDSAELFIAERSPQVPAGHGSEGTPLVAEAFDISAFSVEICDGAFESDVTQGKHVRFSKDHDAE